VTPAEVDGILPAVPLKPSAQKVQDSLAAAGFTHRVVELPDSTRSAAEAAAAVGCSVAQIAKSLVFRGLQSGRAVLVIASGAHRVEEGLLADAAGEPIGKADAEFVREQTGFAIGGVPPVGHPRTLVTLVDEALLAHAEIWAAAGHPKAVFRLTPSELVAMTGGRVVRLAAAAG
jgi:prolyl-tRNA editing enzyme YbaK/EbsC (Cys-tRNA(Pro) deacylase)